ncbi:Hypothetical predicted protein [Pelobates cultripes]|uniref:Uncharacterized protein n=1 Tax=Pelobates cultripes TaxID=61616 RepID=A0AAD1RNG0_PELCU|nr:Hypothetical predicted protein [Pelobates cultripes]
MASYRYMLTYQQPPYNGEESSRRQQKRCGNKIPYRWGHPVRLIIQRNGTFTHVTTPEEGLKALKQWDLLVRKQHGRTTSPQRLRQDWKKAKK